MKQFIRCPKCQARLGATLDTFGKNLPCPKCQHVFLVSAAVVIDSAQAAGTSVGGAARPAPANQPAVEPSTRSNPLSGPSNLGFGNEFPGVLNPGSLDSAGPLALDASSLGPSELRAPTNPAQPFSSAQRPATPPKRPAPEPNQSRQKVVILCASIGGVVALLCLILGVWFVFLRGDEPGVASLPTSGNTSSPSSPNATGEQPQGENAAEEIQKSVDVTGEKPQADEAGNAPNPVLVGELRQAGLEMLRERFPQMNDEILTATADNVQREIEEIRKWWPDFLAGDIPAAKTAAEKDVHEQVLESRIKVLNYRYGRFWRLTQHLNYKRQQAPLSEERFELLRQLLQAQWLCTRPYDHDDLREMDQLDERVAQVDPVFARISAKTMVWRKPNPDAPIVPHYGLDMLNRLKVISNAMFNHVDSYKQFPGIDQGLKGKRGLSWRVYALTQEKTERKLADQFHFDEPWDSPHNQQLIPKIPEIYRIDGVQSGMTTIHVFSGMGTAFGGPEPPGLNPQPGAMSETIMVAIGGPETATPWTQPSAMEMNPDNPLASLAVIDGGHPVVMMDGSVQLLSAKTTPSNAIELIKYSNKAPVDESVLVPWEAYSLIR